jgi:uroporphyrinogen decarboxylase
MNHRERHNAWLEGEKADRVPDYEFGGWDQTFVRWRNEGLPAGYGESHDQIDRYFHTDPESGAAPWGHMELYPGFDYKILKEHGDYIISQDGDGATCESMRPELGASIPRYLRYAIETRKDWEKIRDEKLKIDDPARYPADLDALCQATFTADYPVAMHAGSTYGRIRNWMGVENLSVALMEDPGWVEEMLEHMTRIKLAVFSRVAGKCRLDRTDWWEDICYNAGPLISPELFRKYVVPGYKRVTDLVRKECGCRFNMLDCDGNIHALVTPWVDGGINVMFPIESAHTDVFRIWKQYGRKVPLRGAFDKRALIAGPRAIDAEFDRLLPLIKEGVLVPHTDHRVPPDVSWANFVHYRKRKCEVIGKEYREG